MNPTTALHALGQSLWLDTITRDMLENGTLARYIAELDVTGLTSNPTIYDKAIGGSSLYDADVAAASRAGHSAEETFFSLALDDLRRAADLFRPVHDRTGGVDGYVSLEVSPLLAYDAAATAEQALAYGLSTREELSALAAAWRRWSTQPAAYMMVPSGEVLARTIATSSATATQYCVLNFAARFSVGAGRSR